MLIAVDPHSGVPVYRQIVEQIGLLIAAGRLVEGAELPSTRTLSSELDVNPMTVSKAYSLLEKEGVIVRRPGLPSIVAPRDATRARTSKDVHLRRSLEPVLALARQLGLGRDEVLAIVEAMVADSDLPKGTS